MTHAELVRIFGDKRNIRAAAARSVLYDSDTAALKPYYRRNHPKELPDANSVVAMPTACASMVGTDLLAREDCRVAGFFGAGVQARTSPPRAHLYSEIDRQGACLQPDPRESEKNSPPKWTAILGIEVIAVDSPAKLLKAPMWSSARPIRMFPFSTAIGWFPASMSPRLFRAISD